MGFWDAYLQRIETSAPKIEVLGVTDSHAASEALDRLEFHQGCLNVRGDSDDGRADELFGETKGLGPRRVGGPS